MNLSLLLDEWRRDRQFYNNVAHWEVEPAKLPQYRSIPPWLHEELTAALRNRGISQLYSHQEESVQRVRNGSHVIVTTPTASGKTLCYNLPVLNSVLQDSSSRALYLFPTKALSQDQVSELHELVQHLETQVQSFTYDGDTPVHARQKIREAGHIVVTNPDMLHSAILPHHTKWLRLFENLRYVVIDEAHMYRGVFGSHVANVIRRLRRICSFYGSSPQFILSSATVANPSELARELIGEEAELVDRSGAPSGEKNIILYNPPIVQPQLGLRRGALREARMLGTRLLQEGISTIGFVRTRTQVEVLSSYWKRDVSQRIRHQVMGYRGGYLPNERRAIEKGLRNGEIKGVVSTNALELGVDIGSLEASISVGYPGSVASIRQQSGRAGRRSGLSVAIFIANASALDQYIIQHPEALLHASPEAARLYPDNLLILSDHVKCAAYELPFSRDEEFGVETTTELLEYLAENRVLHLSRDGRYHWMSDALPSHGVSLRSAAQDNVVVIDTSGGRPTAIGETDRFSALTMLHEEAIYLHQSKSYQVEKLDLENGKAFVRPVDSDYYTDAELAIKLNILDVLEQNQTDNHISHHYGEVMVNAMPTLFKKIKFDTHENLGWGKIHLPEAELHTSGYWCSFQENSIAASRDEWETALVGAAYVLRQAGALLCMCSVSDLHSTIEVRQPHTGLPTIFIYDSYPGGIGLAQRLYQHRQEWTETALRMVAGCGCQSGCPSCIGPHAQDDNAKGLTLQLLQAASQTSDWSVEQKEQKEQKEQGTP
ncbi:DEAD/DEAH box helicase [Alicyclobacillus sp. SO9]|uniref:DEAD/DEAH box helicase n=1 Tax=Alicyclobacillus sp. SO9 TaxID=2665646 RepID=UPI0018E8E655|nr:DEAD/DEAH box helicase [Alicyclobacillus sp. SO9]QQE79488.1 DEAD/DEAH box helicase [Alicyclobacillus sp. SO9]